MLFRSPAGTGVRTFIAHVFPVPGEDGTVRYLGRNLVDISERKCLEDEYARIADEFSGTLQAIPDLLFEVDEYGRYFHVRAARKDLLAAPEESLLGRTVGEVLPPDAAATSMAALRAAAANGSDYGRVIELDVNGVPHAFELSVAMKPGEPSAPRRFIVLSRDITARRRAETDLLRRSEELARRNEELERFNHAVVDRELKMVELKQTVNALSLELGRDAPHPSATVAVGASAPATAPPGAPA